MAAAVVVAAAGADVARQLRLDGSIAPVKAPNQSGAAGVAAVAEAVAAAEAEALTIRWPSSRVVRTHLPRCYVRAMHRRTPVVAAARVKSISGCLR